MKTLIILVLSFIAGYSFTGCGEKKTEQQTTPQNNTEQKPNNNTTPNTTNSGTTVPKVGMIWKNIETKNNSFDKIIKSGNYQHLHEAEEIVNLLKSLPSRSQGLGEEKLKSLNNLVTEISRTSSEIDELSHNNKKNDIPAAYEKFKKQLAQLKSIYPAESFKD